MASCKTLFSFLCKFDQRNGSAHTKTRFQGFSLLLCKNKEEAIYGKRKSTASEYGSKDIATVESDAIVWFRLTRFSRHNELKT